MVNVMSYLNIVFFHEVIVKKWRDALNLTINVENKLLILNILDNNYLFR